MLLAIMILSWIQLWLSRGNVPINVNYEGMLYAGGYAIITVVSNVYLIRHREILELLT